MGCLLLGVTLGAVATAIPANFGARIKFLTPVVLILWGAVMIARPHLRHHQDHGESHDWLETAIMRTIGAMTVSFGAYALDLSP